jgi:hypothetical protein
MNRRIVAIFGENPGCLRSHGRDGLTMAEAIREYLRPR